MKRIISLDELKNYKNGFTLIELIVVMMMIGIISAISIPQFLTAANKAKQKEASSIVASMVKAATMFNTEYGVLPERMGDLSEYGKFQKCVAKDVHIHGSKVCKTGPQEETHPDEINFYSPSGLYFIWFGLRKEETILIVTASPTGLNSFRKSGLGVTGCYNPAKGIAMVKELKEPGDWRVTEPTC